MKNNRTFLEKLLDGAEVEWKPLWSITTWDKRFNAVEKEKQPKVIKYHYYLASELKPLIVDGGNIKLLTTNESDIWTTEEVVQNNISEGEIIAIPWGGNPIVQYYKGKFVTADNRIATSNNTKILDNKFLYYFLLSKLDVISSFYRGSGIKHPSMYHVLEMLIPIPPLPVQTEIVKILDALTALTSELTSELILRRKQYEYYREKLLSEEDLERVGGEWKNLKDILINLRTGLNPRNNFKLNTDGAENYYITVRELDSVNIKITDKTDKISNQAREIIDKRSKLNIGDILFSGTGTIGKTAFISELPRNWNIKEGVYALTVNPEIIKPMYLLRLLQSEITKKQINNFVMGSTVKSISMADLKKVKILIPSLDEQQRIVSILDKFETLTNSITEGLPLAIEQSQKRYEYYRELLLNFS